MNCHCVSNVENELAQFVKDRAGDDAKATCMATAIQITNDLGLRSILNIPFRIKGSKKGFTSDKGKEMPVAASYCPFCGIATKPAATVRAQRIYLAGPMTGIPSLNFPLFHAEAARLRALGYDVVNPAEINGGADELAACAAMTSDQLAEHWTACMRHDIRELMTCDGIALLPGWEFSKGASLEYHNAAKLGMAIHMAADLVGGAA